MEIQQSELHQFSQSLEENHSNIEQTQQLIFQIEQQLQALTFNPKNQIITGASSEEDLANKYQQYQNSDRQRELRFPSSSDKNDTNILQRDQLVEIGENADTSGQQISNIYSQLQNYQSQIANLKEEERREHNIYSDNSAQQYKREAGKIRGKGTKEGQICKNIRASSSRDQEFHGYSYDNNLNSRERSMPNQNLAGEGAFLMDIKELQKEHFSEVALLEQAYRKKLISIEDCLKAEKNKSQQTISELQRVIQIMDIQEKENETAKRQLEEELEDVKDKAQREMQAQIEMYSQKLDTFEKEKQSLLQENQDLSRAYKIVSGQNEKLNSKYNRILSLYSQLIQADKDKLVQNNYYDTLNKEEETNIEIQQAPNPLLSLQEELKNNLPSPLHPLRNPEIKQYMQSQEKFSPYQYQQFNKQKESNLTEEIQQKQSPSEEKQDRWFEKERNIDWKKQVKQQLQKDLQQSVQDQDQIQSERDYSFSQVSISNKIGNNQKIEGGNISKLKKNVDEIKAILDGDIENVKPPKKSESQNQIRKGSLNSFSTLQSGTSKKLKGSKTNLKFRGKKI